MMINQIINKLESLRLPGMAKAVRHQFETPASMELSFEERISLIVDTELTLRESLRLKRLLTKAKLKETATIEDVDYDHPRGLDKASWRSLILSDWISQGQNLIITGPTGCGKTWLSCALGNQGCRRGLTVQFVRVPLLLDELALSHKDGSYRRKLAQFSKLDLLILDDLGVGKMSAEKRDDLLEIADGRTAKSTIITSQLPVEKWHDYIATENPTVADAIMDRFTNPSNRINLKGESMRSNRKINI